MAEDRSPLKVRKMNMLTKDSHGFTLIEVMVTTIILTIIVSLSFFSTTFYLNEWQHNRLGDTSAIQGFRMQRLLHAAVESAWEYFVSDPANETIGNYYPYFKGQVDSIAFVTTSPVFTKNTTAAVRIRLVSDKNATTTNLIYEEESLDKKYIRYYDDIINYLHTFTIPIPGSDIKFRYYGFKELQFLPDQERIEEILSWQATFDGKKKQTLPEIIEVVRQSNVEKTIYSFVVQARNYSKIGLYRHD